MKYESLISSLISSTIIYPIDNIIINKHIGNNTIKSMSLIGLIPQYLGTVICKPLNFSLYEYLRIKYHNRLLASGIASLCTILVGNVFYSMTTFTQLVGVTSNDDIQYIVNYFKKNPKMFMKGITGSVIGLSEKMIHYPLLTVFNEEYKLSLVMSAVLSKLVSGSITYPYRVIRSRLRTNVDVKLIEVIHPPYFTGYSLYIIGALIDNIIFFGILDYLKNK